MSYEEKYLKYKNKYLNLQSQIGGGAGNNLINPLGLNNLINPPNANNQIIPGNDLFLELQNYNNAQELRDYIVGVLQANMGGQIPVAILNPPNHFNDNMRDLCRRFFNLFNGLNNQNRDNLLNRLLNLNVGVNNLINNLILELRNYIPAADLRDYIVGIFQANMGGQIPVAILNPPPYFNDNMRDLCRRFFNLFNGANNQIRDDLVNRLLNLNLNNPYNNIINN